jgi:hypothetical protein
MSMYKPLALGCGKWDNSLVRNGGKMSYKQQFEVGFYFPGFILEPFLW